MKEGRRDGPLTDAANRSAGGFAHDEPFLRTCDADEKQPSLFFQSLAAFSPRPAVRKHAVFQPDNRDHRELEPLMAACRVIER